MNPVFFWNGRPVSFRTGETIAAALARAGIVAFSPMPALSAGRVFCGIGACQACAVAVEGGAPVEACLTPARDGLRLAPLPGPGGAHA